MRFRTTPISSLKNNIIYTQRFHSFYDPRGKGVPHSKQVRLLNKHFQKSVLTTVHNNS